MRRLIVNADDFGLTRAVSQAIVRAHQEGIVTSASLLANGEAFEFAVDLARDHATLGVGVHLNLTEGRPVADFPSGSRLIDSAGFFASRPPALARKVMLRQVKMREVEKELRAQIEKVLKTGLDVDHLDSHKHIHLAPRIIELTIRLAQEYRIQWVRCPVESPVPLKFLLQNQDGERWKIVKQYLVGRGLAILAGRARRKFRRAGMRAPEHFNGIAATGFLDKACLEHMLASFEPGTSEIMCHPGQVDASLRRMPTRLRKERETELAALVSPEIKNLVARYGIELVAYKALRDLPPEGQREANEETAAGSAEPAGGRLVSR